MSLWEDKFIVKMGENMMPDKENHQLADSTRKHFHGQEKFVLDLRIVDQQKTIQIGFNQYQ
jgi:hypothetical protein